MNNPYENGTFVFEYKGRRTGMSKQMLFDGLLDLVKESDVDFLEVYVGDEGEGQIYIRFDNLVESEHE